MDRLLLLKEQFDVKIIVAMQYGASESSANKPPWYGPPVLECAGKRGFEILDTYPPLKLLVDEDPQRFNELWLDEGGQLGHMSAAGNGLMAKLFQNLLDEKKLLPLATFGKK